MPSVIEALALHYLNERASESILPYNKDLIERVCSLIKSQKKRSECSKDRIETYIYTMEVERIEWILTEYLQIRLEKLREDFYIPHTLLSEGESKYHNEYCRLYSEEGLLVEYSLLPSRFTTQKNNSKRNFSGIFFLEDALSIHIEEELHNFYSGDFLIADSQKLFELVKTFKVLLV